MTSGARIFLGRLAGVPVLVDWTWFVIFALVMWSLAIGVLPQLELELGGLELWLVAAGGALLHLVCILLHELAHCAVARRERVPIRDIRLFLFGGVATMDHEPPTAASEMRIALAGPACNGALAALCYAEALALRQFAFAQSLAALFALLAAMNLLVAAFNLVPAFPLDGGRVLRGALWVVTRHWLSATLIATRLGEGFALGFIALGAYALVVANPLTGLWLALLGAFLLRAAREARSNVHVA